MISLQVGLQDFEESWLLCNKFVQCQKRAELMLCYSGAMASMVCSSLPWTPMNGKFNAGLCEEHFGRNWSCRKLLLRRPQWVASAVVDSFATEGSSVQLALAIGAKLIPHPDKVEKGGEDAFFISNYDGGVLGIADGVSGWALENVDPAIFSKEFISQAAAAVGLEEVRGDPKALLSKAHAGTTSVGAATAIVAMLLGQKGLLKIASVGDCGLRIIRDGNIVFATSPQQHYFDCPFQFSSELGGQTAADAAVYDVTVEDGDTIVMGSDGLFDNVYDHDIVATINHFGGRDQESAERTATALATLANRNSRNAKYDSPYIKEAIFQGYDVPFWKKLLGQKLTGGKLDDITVLVGHVLISEAAGHLCESMQAQEMGERR